jgi:cytochrome d ubiquinol oxidase subunit I
MLGPAGIIAVIAGWVTTEVGRQPYTIYGLLTTADSVSSVAAEAVGASLAAFVVIYFAVFGAGAFYMLRLMSKVPEATAGDLPPQEPMRAAGLMPGPVMEHAASPRPPAARSADEGARSTGEGSHP